MELRRGCTFRGVVPTNLKLSKIRQEVYMGGHIYIGLFGLARGVPYLVGFAEDEYFLFAFT